VLKDTGPQTVNPWATAISAGPADEAGQTLAFNITNNTNAALFSAAPAVSPTGVLTYTPAANANGSATITLALFDAPSGGNKVSNTLTFTGVQVDHGVFTVAPDPHAVIRTLDQSGDLTR